MQCEDLVAYLSDYIDRELDEELVAAARKHLATCPNCHIVLDSTERMLHFARQSGPQAIPVGRRQKLFDELQAAFLARRPPPANPTD